MVGRQAKSFRFYRGYLNLWLLLPGAPTTLLGRACNALIYNKIFYWQYSSTLGCTLGGTVHVDETNSYALRRGPHSISKNPGIARKVTTTPMRDAATAFVLGPSQPKLAHSRNVAIEACGSALVIVGNVSIASWSAVIPDLSLSARS
jgi:hypothetical protein